ncbi:hypothetical protein DICPUDRAFT_155181 [Dictyostelium purpureum]|uniref:Kinetochore protein Sos7 coiled-coil domain-containing protein n=1 Tax=Dictyostelium purpureum TaxID=5786 RepID=F0ZTA7_DICPU|nr:uncharacterized protein DICPUDRAFT_155181 [Dictyostelium purpureum]EGC32831.1 hypothetical protein DICPUDRAFT_155181 [Dictyostelium purpureum]|eukprot:XP_003290654.1 hypothetical protein DICPUDRAFT_155181 [Dictyostelium purpureum]
MIDNRINDDILFINKVSELLIKYNDEVDHLNNGILDYYYNNGFDKKNLNNIEKELGIVKDCFSKMKWNFIENGNKQIFIKEIISETQITTPSQQSVHILEDKIKEIKKDFNENKEKTKKLFETIIEIINRFSDLNEKFEKEKINLQNSIIKASEYIEKINKLFNQNSQNQNNTNTFLNLILKVENDSNNNNNNNNIQQQQIEKINSSIEWYKKFNGFMESMNDLHFISNIEGDLNSLQFEIKGLSNSRNSHILTLALENQINLLDYTNKLSEKKKKNQLIKISNYTLKPNIEELNKVIQDIVLDSSISPIESFSEITELIYEVKNVISNYYSIESEIQDVSLRYKVNRQMKQYGELSIQLPTGYVCNLFLDSDYPKFSTIEIQSIQKPNSNELVTNLSFIQKEINEKRWNLLQLIDELDYYCN